MAKKVGVFTRLKSFWGSAVRRFGTMVWGMGSGGIRGEESWVGEATRNSRLHTPVHTISSDVAVCDWRVQELADGEFRDIQRLKPGSSAEKLHNLWEKPHPRLTQFDLIYLAQFWKETAGRWAFRMREMDEHGRPGELWPVPPHWIKRIPTFEEPFFKIHFWGEGEVDVPAAEMIYSGRPSPLDPLAEVAAIAQTVDNEVSIDNAMARFGDSYFRNFAMLGVILGIPGYDDNKDEIDAAFKEKHAGAENAFKTLIADSAHGNVTASNLAPKLTDLNFQEARKQGRDFVREGWQVPPERCGIIENSNRSTIDGADYFQQSKNVLPRLKQWAQELDLKLTPLFDNRNKVLAKREKGLGRLRLWFENPVTETADHQLKVTAAGFRAGWMTVNEARGRHGLKPIPGGDVLLIPTNNVTAVMTDGELTTIGQAPKKGGTNGAS